MKAIPARKLYTDQPTATWYQVQTGASDAAAVFTSFTATTPKISPIPAPDDKNQISGSIPWNVDHIFELQVIGEAFKADRPSSIPAADWASASNAVFKSGPSNLAIANAVTNLDNLRGIPSALNGFKKQVFTFNLTGKGGPSSGDGATYFNFFGPAVQKYLLNDQAGLLAGTVDETGNQLQLAGNGNVAIKSYFTSYASVHYQGCIDFLSTWTGKPLPSSTTAVPTTTAASPTTSPTSTTTGAAITCEHAADPDNECAAIANSPGWCDCGDDTKYAVMPSPAPQPCAWTTFPPPTANFDCAPKIAPVNPPGELECKPTPEEKPKDAHEQKVQMAAERFCHDYANSEDQDPATLPIEQTLFVWLGTVVTWTRGNDSEDDVYDMKIELVQGCTANGPLNVAKPVDGQECADILHSAWKQCNNQGRGGSLVAGCLRYSIAPRF